MSPELADYIEAGYALTPEERLEAARMLQLSVDRDAEVAQEDVDAEWDAVIERRVAEVLSGTVQLVDGAEAHARIRQEIVALRK